MNLKSLFLQVMLVLILSGCQPSGETSLSGEAQGTTYHIKLVMTGVRTPIEDIKKQVYDTLSEIDAQMSNYREDSEISRLNQLEKDTWLPVSKEISEMLVIARSVYERSNGCYDLTTKPLFDLWGFSSHVNRVPADQEIDNLLPHVGMSLLEIDDVNHRVRKKDLKVKIDLSSIAQGYSVGVLAKRIEALGVHNYLIELGGEMMVKGRKTNGNHWRVGIESPTPLSRELGKVLDIREQYGTAVMTAGTYRNFFEDSGTAYSHILNPKTGRPVTHHLRSVTVMHDDPAWADAWDTALLCVGEKEAIRIVETENLKALLIYESDNNLKEYMSKAFISEQQIEGNDTRRQ
jgi:FAD:protein FMN transferase